MSEHDIDQSLVQLRQAMRLCFEYQQSMLSVAYYIKNKQRFPVVKGYKHFSDALSPRHTLLWGTWAWDFLPSYFFEYYLDSRSFEEQGLYLKAALLQCTQFRMRLKKLDRAQQHFRKIYLIARLTGPLIERIEVSDNAVFIICQRSAQQL